MDFVFDLAIVGAGMFGSSCARWASEDVESSVLVSSTNLRKANQFYKSINVSLLLNGQTFLNEIVVFTNY